MLCFRCGSYNVDDAAACSVCGQGFTDAKSREARAGKKASDKAALGVFAPGEVVGGKYRVIEVIGQGGVGAVYKARDVEIDVDVALKAISPNLLQTEEEQRLFSRMMKQARKLHHANIIRIYDEGAEGQRRYFTMKLLEGLTLRKIIRLRHDKGQSFSPEEIVPIFHQLASAFDYAHKTTWHGDLKPENVIILPDLLKVTDFNLVKGLPLKPFLGIAKSRSKGFPYIAPELRVESTQVDGRVDIYSMGVILAEMLTGLVYEGHFTRAMTAALEQLPTKLDGLVRRSLSEHPDGRFPKAGDMARELEAALEKLPKAALPPPAGKAPKKRRATPPPPPAETNPGVVPEHTDQQADDHEEDPSLEEIGQSQVLLLDESPPTESSERSTIDGGDIAPGAGKRREERAADVVKGMKPPPLDGVDGEESDDHDDARPASAASRKPPLPEDRVGDRGDDGLIPPPLPENADLDASDSYDIPAGVSVRGLGSREQGRPPRRLRDDGEEEETLPDLEEVGIHEELTALKPQPRPAPVSVPPTLAVPQLPDDEDDVPSDVETVTRAARSSADSSASSDEEEPPAMASAAELALAKERSSPRLHAAQPIAPPVVATQASGIHSLPPGLRPVAPPERKKSAGGIWIGVAAVAVVIVFGVVVVSGGDKDDGEPAESALATGPTDDEKPGDATADPTADDGKTDPAEAAVVAEGTPPDGDDDKEAPSDKAATAAAEEKAKAEAAELARLAKLEEEERRRQEEAEQRRADDDKKRPDDEKVASAEDSRREAERAAAAAREKAEAEEKRRLEEERRRQQDKRAQQKKEEPKLAAVAADPTKVKCPAGMQLIPAGSFTMGSTPSDPMRNFGENLATKTDVAAYCIDYYEFPNSSSRPPTTSVSWTQAKNACASKGRRLCTEAEWERGCKGPGNKRFAYGNTYDADKCNTEDPNGGARTVKGARDFKKCRSGFGVYATSGNAEEWVADSFRPGAPSKVAKGGSVDRPDWASRCAARRGVSSSTKTATLGFRCCADPQ